MFFTNKSKKLAKQSHYNQQLRSNTSHLLKTYRSKSKCKKYKKCIPTLKEKQLRNAIEYRFKKSNQNYYIYPDLNGRNMEDHENQQFAFLKDFHVVNLKQYHNKGFASVRSIESIDRSFRSVENQIAKTIVRNAFQKKIKSITMSKVPKAKLKTQKQRSPKFEQTRPQTKKPSSKTPPIKHEDRKYTSIQLKDSLIGGCKKIQFKIHSHRDYSHSKQKIKQKFQTNKLLKQSQQQMKIHKRTKSNHMK